MGVLAAVVVVVTAGALTMPASTMTADVATLPEGASVPEGYSQSYTAKDEQNGVVVTAYAPEGVVPEGATLKARLLDQNGDEYAAAKQAAGVTDDEGTGFAAMDVSFVDAGGNEVEPTGDVYVNIDAAGILPDDADPESVVVQHLAEDENGTVVSADAVADAADATSGVAAVASDDATAVQAAFTTDSFSTFTITWNETALFAPSTDIEVTCLESGSDPLPDGVAPKDVSLRNGVPIQFNSDNEDLAIAGYTFDRAEYSMDGVNWQELNSVKATRHSSSILERWWGYSVNNGSEQRQAPQIRLYYTKNSGGGEGGTTPGGTTTTENATVQTGKTAVLRDDGNYDLTLSISGDRGSATSPAPVDVLFIVDRSASMTNDRSPRLQNAKTAMKTLVNSLEGNANIDAQYSIVTFSGPGNEGNSNKKNDASVHMGWTAVSENNVSNSIDGITASGGTDYQAGLDVGTDQLGKTRPGATKVVIFLSDGEPTWSYNYGKGTGSLCLKKHNRYDNDCPYGGKSNCTYQGWLDTLNQAAGISCDYFYAIGIGSSSNSYLNGLVNSVHATTKQRIEAANDGSNLTNLFNGIAANVTFFAAQNVTITDPLSQYADLVLTNNAPQFTVSVTNGTQTWSDTVAPGESLTFYDKDGKAQTATPRVSDDNRTIYLDLPASYQLEEGYTYSISTVITPSDAAKSYVGSETNRDDQETPDTGTGTHADKGEKGFWSNDNDNAKVTYTANGESGSENFPKPVIQVPVAKTGSLTINKEVTGASVSDQEYSFVISTDNSTVEDQAYSIDDSGSSVTFNKVEDGETATYQAEVTIGVTSTDSGVNGSVTINGLPLGTTYSVTEKTDGININGYKSGTPTYSPTNGSVTLDEQSPSQLVTVTNPYVPLSNITIDKTVTGATIPSLSGAEFKLTLDESTEPIKFVKISDGSYRVADESDSETVDVLTTGNDGEATLDVSGLQYGTYILTETKAPAGYNPLDTTIKISWNDEGQVTAGFTNGTEFQLGTGDHSGHLIVPNSTSETTLPNTGGTGNTPLIVGGLLLIAAAGCGYGLRRRHEGRGARS